MRAPRTASALVLSLAPPPSFARLAWCEEPMHDAPANMTVVYMVLLKRGPSWSPQQTPETQKVQEAHMANIRAMWEAKKLIIAGPFGDDSDLRGVFIFQVGSLEEAKALAASDPAVKAGRPAGEVHPWWAGRRAPPGAGPPWQASRGSPRAPVRARRPPRAPR